MFTLRSRLVNFKKLNTLNRLSKFQQERCKSSSMPMNTVICFVRQQEAWVVERMGKFHKILQPGFNLLFPIIDSIQYVQVLKELAIEVPKQSAVTSDNVTLSIDGVLYLKVFDPYKASYGVHDPEFAVTQLAQTTMRSELGKISLDTVFKERELLNIAIVEAINKAANEWGLTCLRYEIRDIKLPERVQEAMQMQVEAERKKRAQVLESEGTREAEINVAEGKKKSRILASEAQKIEQINKAEGRALALKIVADQIKNDGLESASLTVAEQYVKAFGELAKKNNTLILSNNVSDVSSMVTNAMAIYKQVLNKNNIGEHSNESDFQNDLDQLDKK